MPKYTPEELEAQRQYAEETLQFLRASPSQFHAVAETIRQLKAAGYQELGPKDLNWDIKPNGAYYITRNQSAIVAFRVGGRWKAGNGAVLMGAHTDSPVFKLKPLSKADAHGYLRAAVQPYGGGLWHTWFDRELSLAGRVIVFDPATETYEAKLVDLERPVMRIPNLAIHLNRDVGTKGFNPNKESETVPILGTQLVDEEVRERAKAAQQGSEEEAKEECCKENSEDDAAFDVAKELVQQHGEALIGAVCSKLNIKPDQVRGFELCLYDTQPAQLTGLHEEFIASRGLDNLLMSSVCLRSLLSAEGVEDCGMLRVVALFDNEEVGSQSEQGADSNLLPEILKRLNPSPAEFDSAIARSILVSADMAHALHPNYPDKHEARHRPSMHAGLVIKDNANQRYATSSITAFYMTELARQARLPVQRFVVRNDSGCGSTIGPILAGKLAVPTLDVGVAQLAMHSIREMCSARDAWVAHKLLTKFFEGFEKLADKCKF